MLLPSQTPLKGSQGPQESLDHTLKTTALENSCTCAPGDMYENSLIPQASTMCQHCSRHCECVKQTKSDKKDKIPAHTELTL